MPKNENDNDNDNDNEKNININSIVFIATQNLLKDLKIDCSLSNYLPLKMLPVRLLLRKTSFIA